MSFPSPPLSEVRVRCVRELEDDDDEQRMFLRNEGKMKDDGFIVFKCNLC